MTETERKVMQEHALYWKDLTDKRIAVVFGPVLDPKGVWGLAIVETANEQDVRTLGLNDPALKAGLTFGLSRNIKELMLHSLVSSRNITKLTHLKQLIKGFI